MLKKYELEAVIEDSLLGLDGVLIPCEDNKHTLSEANVKKDDNGDFILLYKEDFQSDYVDRYRIKIEYF